MSFTRAARSLHRYRPQVLRWLAGLAVCTSICALYLSGSLLFIDRQLTSARFQLVTSDPTDDVVVVLSGLWLFIRLCPPEVVRETVHDIAAKARG